MRAGSVIRTDTDQAAQTLSISQFEPVESVEHSPLALRWRRFGDFTLATVGYVVAALPMLVIAALVKLTSKGPVLFTQERIGRDGVPFQVLKFRSMADGTHTDVLSSETERREYIENDFKLDPSDKRITPLGKFLRKTSLDELPQLINIIKGDMSLVGIRPLVPLELGMRPSYDQDLYRSLRPGLTGLWQVEGRSAIEKVERYALDRRYIETWSPWNDVKILVRTPFALLRVHHTQ